MTVEVVLTVREGASILCQARANEVVPDPEPSERLAWPYPEGKTAAAERSPGLEAIFHSHLTPTEDD